MNKQNFTGGTNGQAAQWLGAARHIVSAINELCRYHAPQTQGSNCDYSKLLCAAEKLGKLINSQKTNPDPQKTWHGLRNVMATIQGYIALIQEGQRADNSNQLQLDNIHQLSVDFLQDDSTNYKVTIEPQRSLNNLANGTILVIDDQQESREIIKRYLLHDQHRVLEAASGKEMLTLLEQQQVDLILLDLILPEMDGHELLARLKGHNDWRAIPVIVISGNKDTERVIRCIEAGAEDYFFKPINPILLQARINAGIERKRWLDREQKYRLQLEKNQQFIRKIFGRYVSEEIANSLLENPDGLDLGGTQCKTTIMMADIRDFTPIAEKLPPQQVVRLLNIFLAGMSDIIMAYNGTVNEFIGDAILAIFGAPVNRDDDSDRAIECALAMQAAMESINQQNTQEGLPIIEMGISLNTGPVIAGNIGSLKRTKYGVVGHTVNQTARIEDACPAGKILISESTLNDSKAQLTIGESKTIKAKGILKAIKVFQLISISPNKNKTKEQPPS